MSKRFYITTAIDYVNGEPHLGHAYEKIVADVIARIHRSLGDEVFFLTGLDEHGQKVQQAAAAVQQSPQDYCDALAARWQAFTQQLHLSHDDFIRTTQPRHQAVVAALLTKLHHQGDLYKAPYRGWYSSKEETFLTDKDRRPDGSFDPAWGEVSKLIEDNWYFRMGQHQNWLIQYLESHPDFVQPDSRRNEVLGFLRSQSLEDLCISRPKSRLAWGIPLPFDPDYVNYVWFDALTNYFSVPAALGDPRAVHPLQPYYTAPPAAPSATPFELWPANIHLLGKDIVKFHSVYWPIMLHAAGIDLPHQILVHGWWLKDGAKMSKSTGNVVDPLTIIRDWGVDAFRYFVVRELDIGPDGNWTDVGFQARYTAELANGLGNLVNRSLSMLQRYRKGVVPPRSDELAAEITTRIQETINLLRTHRLQSGLQSIAAIVTRANQYVDHTAPFRLAKDPSQTARLGEILYNLAETCRLLAPLLWPFIPTTAERILSQLNLPGKPDRLTTATWGGLTPGHIIGSPIPLFPRLDTTTTPPKTPPPN